MEPSTTLKGRLFDLKQRFVQTMPDRVAAIASTLAGCVDGGREVTDRLERQFHTLGGTAGTYDLHAVAAAAFEGEEACMELNQFPLDSDNFTDLTFLVDQLRVALATDAPPQWTARTVLTAADARAAASEQTGVFAA
jgi:HPt (histidine-containing phosphotransfer) domain-containing protein